ncbi:probable inactive histone-lysine N-methyltransferase SUVR1 [Impatiens glandulifera]|uniref:probable inactive histone-lysine N-methyltransferase SUVR1 n=1 Tax=Impatiens glandulifera TaxID=253017 RepID=UPI001FB15A3B|nr:probable inactive histone-lysine N-methyltransferase SUVR1 [Impatiens glandulifera]
MAPPRGRNRKPRNTRMDAAIDALLPMGFPRAIVRKRVNHLLSVYGGDESWKFIEEDAYKVLIDSFLDEQEESMSIQCIEDKKDDDTSIREGEIVPCLENEAHLEVAVPLRRSYELSRSDDESDDDEMLHFDPATSPSHILFAEPEEGNACVFHGLDNKNIEMLPLPENISSQASKGKSLIQLNNNCSGSGIGRSDNIKQEVSPPHMNNNIRREKRQLVRLTSDPYHSHI